MNKCMYCGLHHETVCPRVSAITYWPDGITIKRIDFHTPATLMSSESVKIALKWPVGIKTAMQ